MRNIALLLGSLLIALLGAEFLLSFDSFKSADQKSNSSAAYVYYTPQELDPTLPLYLPEEGGNCVVSDKSYFIKYSPYFGWNAQKLNLICAENFFNMQKNSDKIKVIYFGGSAMANFEAPNYLTKIDHYVRQYNSNVISLNLAESGARSTNNLVRLMLEAIDLSADYWVFFDGFNEFNSWRIQTISATC